MIELPEQFVETMRRELGCETGEALCRALDEAPTISLRINTRKTASEPYAGERIPWSRDGRYLSQRPEFTLDPSLHAGAYYVQEPSSQFVGHILSSEPLQGACVLDMCAAPGGKTTIYSTLVGDDGLVIANEINRTRSLALADNVRRWGLGNVLVTNNEPRHVAAFEEWFDVVAVDAPCSGEGMFRKTDEARTEWNPRAAETCAARQREILAEAWRTLRPGGILLYSTCTFNRTEDEDVVAWAQSQWHDMLEPMSDIECPDAWGIARSRIGAFQTFRFMPHSARGEGFFAAAARKKGDRSAAAHRARPKSRRRIFAPADKRTAEELQRWVAEPDAMTFRTVGDTLYGYRISQLPDIAALSETLSAVYSGVAMGQMFKQRLRPDHALALYVGLNSDALPRVDVDRATALDYLRRRDIATGIFEEGFNAVTYDGLAIGFVKRIGSRCNNLYPKDLRILKT